MKFVPYHLPILMYHQILPKSDAHFSKHIAVDPEVFREQVQYLLDQGYKIKTVRQYFEEKDISAAQKCAILTFDDVSSTFLDYAKPILDRFGVKASIFPIKNMTFHGTYHNLSKEGIRALTEEELKKLHQEGFELGSHCLSHQNLRKIPFQEAKKEIQESKAWLESLTQTPVATICYPIGGIDRDIVEASREAGYKNGLSILKGSLQFEADQMSLRRVDIKNNVTGSKLKFAIGPFYGFRRFITRPFRAKYRVSARHPDFK